jgi:hypothetical protein
MSRKLLRAEDYGSSRIVAYFLVDHESFKKWNPMNVEYKSANGGVVKIIFPCGCKRKSDADITLMPATNGEALNIWLEGTKIPAKTILSMIGEAEKSLLNEDFQRAAAEEELMHDMTDKYSEEYIGWCGRL